MHQPIRRIGQDARILPGLAEALDQPSVPMKDKWNDLAHVYLKRFCLFPLPTE